MFRALDIGLSAGEFWEMSPRAVVALCRTADQARRIRPAGKVSRPAADQQLPAPPERLNRIPR